MRALILLALPLAFACSPAVTTTETTTAATTVTTASTTPAIPECMATSVRDWRAGADTYRIEGRVMGANCVEAEATLTVSAPDGGQVYAHTYRITEIPLAFRPTAAEQSVRQTEVEAWTQNTAPAPRTANALPAWPAAADKPPHFAPAPGVSREQYQAARTARRPIFCYPDGAESNACIALDPQAKTATLLGSQTPERP